MSFHSPPFITNTNTISVLMSKVLLALIPALLIWVYLYGAGSIIQFFLCVITCYSIELLILKIRGKAIRLFLQDGTAMITALLLAFCLPPLAPWWLSVCACIFAMLLGKHVYGGLGQNIFNPAMIGYAIVLISFPAEFAVWQGSFLNDINIDFKQAFGVVFLQQEAFSYSSATLLSESRGQAIPTNINWLEQPSFYLSISFLIGGLFMLLLRVIQWHIPVGVIIGLCLMVFLTHSNETLLDSLSFHLFTGATMIGAFFIATDPVSAATSNKGKFCYALMIGVLVIIIRTWGNFPDGFAFAVLLANLSVPIIDRYLKQ
jgi:electron transport complex protein RnfD